MDSLRLFCGSDFLLFLSPDPPVHNETEVEVLTLESDTILNCTVSSNPSPDYAWTWSGTSEKMGSQPILRVNQAGNYTCTASNQLGRSSKRFRVEARSSGESMSSSDVLYVEMRVPTGQSLALNICMHLLTPGF